MPPLDNILIEHFPREPINKPALTAFLNRLSKLNDTQINKLKKLIEEIGANPFPAPQESLIPIIFRKFKTAYKNKSSDFNKRELRTLTYSLSFIEMNFDSIFRNEMELKYVFELLESNWRDTYLVGLIDTYLRSWETKESKSLELLESFIVNKLDQYTGNRSALLSFKNNKRFFSIKNGDLILGDTLAKLNKPIREAVKVLGVPESWFEYAYFSKVITTYFEKNKDNLATLIDSLDEILSLHILAKTKKRLIPSIIIQLSDTANIQVKDKIKKIAITHLKDPLSKSESLWGNTNDITELEFNNLQKAKTIIIQWLTEEFIDFFFKECIYDIRRRNFWIKYSKKISLFKIVGSLPIKHKLLRNKAIANYVDVRFASTNSQGDLNSAFMFVINDYLIVEFSDKGAFYAYKVRNPKAPSIDSNYFYQTSDLKDTSMVQIAYRTGHYIHTYNQEGKLPHNDADLKWEDVASKWLEKIAGVYV
jgi:hypothetical protein